MTTSQQTSLLSLLRSSGIIRFLAVTSFSTTGIHRGTTHNPILGSPPFLPEENSRQSCRSREGSSQAWRGRVMITGSPGGRSHSSSSAWLESGPHISRKESCKRTCQCKGFAFFLRACTMLEGRTRDGLCRHDSSMKHVTPVYASCAHARACGLLV